VRPPLESLLERARAGDPRAFETLTGILRPELLRFLTHYLNGDEHAALDVLQETFLQAWRSVGTIRDADHLRRWLYTVARCRGVSWIRRRAPPGRRMVPYAESLAEGEGPPRERAEHVSEREEEREALRRAIDALPESYGGPVRLHYFHGCDTREAARLLGIPRSSLKMRLHRARAVLRRALQQRRLSPRSRARVRDPSEDRP
jgi:RNA polymerase sigma-70 factor (ECF subfamily)